MAVTTREAIDKVLQAAAARGDVPGVVAMAADDTGTIYEGAAGKRAADADDAITPDTMLRVASMTKMVVTVAALQLVEKGRLELDAPVESYRPEIQKVQGLEGFDGDTPRLRPPAARATVRQLMSHMAGFGYWFWNKDIDRYEQVTGTPNCLAGKEAFLFAPMVADPGTRFEYGISSDWLGRVVEAVSGQTLDAYIKANITDPLGMTNTTAKMTAAQRANSTPIHMRGDGGAWAVTDLDWPQEPDFWCGSYFLYSTPRDYIKFQRMLLGGGALGDVRILEKATVDSAFVPQVDFPPAISTAHPELSADFNVGPGFKFGIGLFLNEKRQPGMRAAGSGAWAGLFNTHFWVDPASRVTGSIFSQCLPFVEPRVFQMYADFEQALYASLGK